MSNPLNILAVSSSTSPTSITRIAIEHTAALLRARGCVVDVLDLATEPLPLLHTETSWTAPYFAPLQQRVTSSDVFLLGTPDYHGGISGGLKNFLDHFWREFAGKLFATIVASHEKGLTVTDQLRTIARQCYAWAMPYGVSLAEDADVTGGKVVSEASRQRLDMFARDVAVYGAVLAEQRGRDLAGNGPGFLARHRK